MRGRGGYLEHLSQVPLFSACSKKDLQTIAKASDERAFDLIHMKVDPRFDPLREDRRFHQIARQVGVA